MSSNKLKFKLKKEVELDKNLNPIDGKNENIYLYGCSDGIWACMQSVKSIEEARELIMPETIDETFSESLSDIEMDEFYSVLKNNPKYHFFDEVYDYDNR